ncbi:MAG: putative ABC transporter-binding protein precursor [Chloroflexi bacterium ADurb.Bin325]|nr:MAG: putative ABC transporter-binding protein precursor [Chloroflexi bacterium ADurb.Bin325]
MRTIKRREFLKLSAALTVGGIAAACSPAAPAPAPEAPAEPPAQAPAEQAAPAAEAAAEAPASAFKEAPMLAERVAAGTLPPVDQRLPEEPLIMDPVESIGEYGGTIRMMDMGHLLMTIGAEPLVKWKRDLNGTRPNVITSWKWNDEATELVAQFRKGIKWSDGEPFTVDDYLFWWNDMVLDETIGLSTPAATRVNGEPMQLEKIDDYTLKFTFAASHPLFLDLGARGYYNSAWFLVPAHYLKQFHPRYNSEYTDATEILARYNNRLQYSDFPVLYMYKTTDYKADDYVKLERNPYYWKVDPDGQQLPYIDKFDVKLIPAGGSLTELAVLQSIAGNIDFQIRDFNLKDVPLLRENADKGGYEVRLWSRGDFAWPWLILYYDYPDEGIVDLMYNQKFRTALSIAIDRDQINEVAALGLGKPRQAALSPESPEFQTPEGKEVYDQWVNLAATYEPEQAKALLDEINVKDVNGDGFRERPDGTALELIVSVAQGDTQSIEAMNLIKQTWEGVGIKTVVAPDEGSVFNQNVSAGNVMIRAWGSAAAWGLISASPVWAPVEGVSYCMGGARIGLYYQTGGKEGIPPRPGSMLETLQQRYTEVISTNDPTERTKKLLNAYRVHIDDGPLYIGTIGDHPSALVVNKKLKNVQNTGLVAGWDLGFPGTADPEQFYYAQ